MSHQVAPRVP